MERKTSRPLELVFKVKFLDTSRLEFMKIEYIENKDLQTKIKTFIDSLQHHVRVWKNQKL